MCMKLGLSVYILQRGSLNFSTGQGTQRERETLNAFFSSFFLSNPVLYEIDYSLSPVAIIKAYWPTNLKLTAKKSKL